MSSKKENSWPVGIFVFYGLFVAALLIAVFITMNNDMEMVTDNYYEKTLKYEDQINRIWNTRVLAQEPDIAFNRAKTVLVLTMPDSSVQKDLSGIIHLFRPSDFRLDRKFALQPDNQGKQHIPVADLENGKWEVQIQWSDGQKEYYFEKVIIL